MNDQTKQRLKEKLKDYMDEHLTKSNQNDYMYQNPFNKGGNEQTPSLALNIKEPTQCRDFISEKSYDIFSLHAALNGLDNNNDFKKVSQELMEWANITDDTTIDNPQKYQATEIKKRLNEKQKKDYTDYYSRLGDIYKYQEAINYLHNRHISDRLIKKYNILFDDYKKQIVIPCSNYFYVGRNIDEEKIKMYGKHYKPFGATVELFNYNLIKNSGIDTALYITESITDALTLEDAEPQTKVIALNSTSNKNKLIEALKQNKYKGYVILFLDADKTGIKASQELKKGLEAIGIYAYICNDKDDAYFGEWEPSEDNQNILELTIKDLNELAHTLATQNIKYSESITLKDFIDDKTQDAQEQYKKYVFKDLTPTSEYITELENDIKNTDIYRPTTTTIKVLDEALNGGLFAKQIITLIADTSTGKTAFALQLADCMANDRPILYFSLEMSQSELIARSLSRIMSEYYIDNNGNNYNLTQLDILQGKQYNSIEYLNNYNLAKEKYKEQVKDNLFIYECLDNNTITEIESKINTFIAKTQQKPIVFIDYLQYIDADEPHATDKQAADKIIRTLKKIARSQALTIFIISSTARSNYYQETNIASAKNSGDIEFTSDIVLGLNLQAVEDIKRNKDGKLTNDAKAKIKEASKERTRELYLTVLKNRNGKRDIAIKGIQFTPSQNKYSFEKATVK